MKNATIIGAGTMGNGIAHVLALSGIKVCLIDLDSKILDQSKKLIVRNLERQEEKGTITGDQIEVASKNLTFSLDLERSVNDSDIIIEAIVEKESAKINLFRQLDMLSNQNTILASNTSSISITQLGAVTKRPEKVVGMHFMNPVPIMKLVEVIKGLRTNDETVGKIKDLCENINKVPVLVNDFPGFVSNRILMPMINEAIFTVYERVAGISQIDAVMTLGMSHPMGPLKLADFIGLDVCLDILNVLHGGFGDPKYAPCPLLIKMVNAGFLGVKSGSGFYNWKGDPKNPQVTELFN